jgi:hypothetical protein
MLFGIDHGQFPLCDEMPRFNGIDPMYPAMTDLEADDIIAYLRSLPPVVHEIPPSQCTGSATAPLDMAVPADDGGAGHD